MERLVRPQAGARGKYPSRRQEWFERVQGTDPESDLCSTAHLGSGHAVLSQIAPSRNSLDLAWSAQAQARHKRHRKSHFSSQRTEPKQVPENLWARLAHVVCRQFARIFFLGPNV
nr:putative integron gene cassette protein [uncultured bacterium]